jgi:iron complex transport system ATP-binding protein
MAILRTVDLSIGHGRRRVGSGIGLAVGNGEVLALLGPNGAGKTTLFKTMLCLLPALSGSVEIDGENIAHWPRTRLARRLAYVPQAQAATFPYTGLQMVLMGRTAHVGITATPSKSDYAAASHALGTLGISHFAGRIYTELSGGERQLVLIARALCQGADFLIMDEPTASLDFGNQLRVLEIVRRLATQNNVGVVLSTHNPDQAFLCADRALLLADGRPIAYGTPREVITTDHLRTLYGISIAITAPPDAGRPICVPMFAASPR